MFRNREIRQFAVFFAVITAVAVLAGFSICPAAAILILILATVYGVAFFLFTGVRYQRISQISDQIDLILHNEDKIYISESNEGELSILQSEIAKMTLRIREQNNALKEEKNHLADSLADIAHQLRTPLTSVNIILSLLENHPAESKRISLIREMEELMVRMDWLITSLLKLSRLDAGIVVFQKEQINMKELIDNALRPLLIPMDLHDITLRTNVPEGSTIVGDLKWYAEALQNILKNCMESAGDGGKIDIVCENTPIFTEITIRDSGVGIKKEDIPFLFDRFYQGKNSNIAGYGIGLALCKTIVTGQGGTIKAGNHPKGGAFFTIRFPT